MTKATCARNKRRRGSTALQLALFSCVALAPPAAHAQTKVVTPVLTQTLDFGTFAVLPSCNNCTITISPAGVRTPTAGIVILSSKNNGRPAKFTVTCNTGSCTYTPTVSGAPSMNAGGVTLSMGTFTFSKSPTNTTSTLSVGARLTIPNKNAAVGTFTSTAFTLATANP
jgi:hypothetical protein